MQSLLKPLRGGLQSFFRPPSDVSAQPPAGQPRRMPPGAPLMRHRPNGDDVSAAEAYNRRFLLLLPHRPWLRHVKIVAERDACLACRAQPYELALDELPALPHRRCTRQWGCACWYEAPEPKRPQRRIAQ